MDEVKISDLPEATVIKDEDIFTIIQDNVNKKIENNKIGNVIVSSTEPVSDRRKVWIKKGKNLFNAYNNSYYARNSKETYVINNSNSISVSGDNTTWTRIAITVKNLIPNKKYTISASVSNPSGHYSGLMLIEGETERNSVSQETSFNPKITFTSNNNGTLELNLFSNWSSSSLSETVVFSDIQLEQGEEKTTFEAYIDKKINIKNDNNVYEEFYNENNINIVTDFKNDVTFNETIGSYNLFKKNNKVITICFQGENKSHSMNDLLFTLPAGYRPSEIIGTYFSGYGVVYGNVWIGTDGKCTIANINSSSTSARIVFSISYIIN